MCRRGRGFRGSSSSFSSSAPPTPASWGSLPVETTITRTRRRRDCPRRIRHGSSRRSSVPRLLLLPLLLLGSEDSNGYQGTGTSSGSTDRRRQQRGTVVVSSSSSSISSAFETSAGTTILPPSFVRWKATTTTATRNRSLTSNDDDDDDNDARWLSSTLWRLETAVITYERSASVEGGGTDVMGTTTTTKKKKKTFPGDRVDLHAVVHLGETQYYDDLNDDLSPERYGTVVYELLVDETLLTSKADTHSIHNGVPRVLQQPVGASASDRALAAAYRLTCQADAIDYTAPNFVHGDWTRQELERYLRERQNKERTHKSDIRRLLPSPLSPLLSLLSRLRRQQLHQKHEPEPQPSTSPLWQQANRRWSSPTQEVTTALWVGPPILLQAPPTSQQRRRSSDTFRDVVRRRAIRWFLRPMLWLTVPSPEISIVLLDWSALNGDAAATDATGGAMTFPSPVSRAVLTALAAGNWDAARKLVFGQVLLVSSSSSSSASAAQAAALSTMPDGSSPSQDEDDEDDQDWIRIRNQRAVEVLDHALQNHAAAAADSPGAPYPSSIALLYGCLHGPDLHARLVARGFDPVETKWRTAWSVPIPNFESNRLLDVKVLQLLAVLVLYLGLGGLDWIATVGDVTRAASDFVRDDAGAIQEATANDGASSLSSSFAPLSSVLEDYGLYLVRHLFLYVGLSKFIWSTGKDET